MQARLDQVDQAIPAATLGSIGVLALLTASNLLFRNGYADLVEGLAFGLATGLLTYATMKPQQAAETFSQARNILFPPAPKRREAMPRREPAPEAETPRAGM